MRIDILDDSGAVVSTILADEAFCEEHHPGKWQIAEGEEPALPAAARHITVLGFRNRFTQAERIAIEIGALDDASAPMPQRMQAAALRASQKDCNSATYIDLDRADTRAGVSALEAAGVIGAGRADAILDAAVQAHEQHQP